ATVRLIGPRRCRRQEHRSKKMPRRDHFHTPGRHPRAHAAPTPDHVGKTFTGSGSVDGNRYVHCTFKGGVMVYGGGVPPSFSGCHFTDSKLSFVGAAASTLAFLKAMDSPSSGLQRIVRETFGGFSAH